MKIVNYNNMEISLQNKGMEYIFKNDDNDFNKSEKTRKSELLGAAYGSGENLYFAVKNNDIVGTMAMVLMEIETKGEAYIVSLRADDNDAGILVQLIEHGRNICLKAGATDIITGLVTRYKHFDKAMLELGFKEIYRLVMLHKNNIEYYDDKGELVKLSRENASDYAEIMTQAFLDSPNGAGVNVEEAIEALENNPDFGLYKIDDAIVGAYELEQRENAGWIDGLAIPPKHQNKGYGKKMFRLVQNHLWQNNCSELKMTVIDANKYAYDMYLKHGFTLEKILSTWYKI